MHDQRMGMQSMSNRSIVEIRRITLSLFVDPSHSGPQLARGGSTLCFKKGPFFVHKKGTHPKRTLGAQGYGPAAIISLIGYGGSTTGAASLPRWKP